MIGRIWGWLKFKWLRRKYLWEWLNSSDEITWAGHGLQGFVIVLIADVSGLGFGAGIYATLVHFTLRESPGLVFALRAGDAPKLRDGLFDLMAPIAGIALYALLLG